MTQKEALDILKLGHNVFLTGSAGSGKTFLLNQYIDHLKGKGVEVGITAPTGIAATHMNGVTIHSWSGMGIKDSLSNKDLQDFLKKRYLAKRFERTKVLVIDEVSMLHPFQLDMVDRICKTFKENNLPFGGMQVVLCGDFFQLPPIAKGGQEVSFVNKSDIWNNMDLKVCYLKEQHRHEDNVLTQILNDIRENNTGEHTLVPLRTRYKKDLGEGVTPTKLYTHNFDVDAINQRELDNIESEERTYPMFARGSKKLKETLIKSCLAPETLRVKIGAKVMFVKNNIEKGYVNGTLGTVVGFDKNDDLPIVRTLKGDRIFVESESWRIEEDGKIKAEIIQVPLRLAWAITVHKSQGMTLDAAEMDLSKSFVEGMGYVALSRVRSLNGLRLMGLNNIALQVNEEVLNLNGELESAAETVLSELSKLDNFEKKKRQDEFLASITPPKKEPKLSTYEETKLLIDQQYPIEEIAEKRGLTNGTIVSHLEKMIEKGEELDLAHIRPPEKHLNKILAAFNESESIKLSPVKELLGDEYSFDEIRLARLFLKK